MNERRRIKANVHFIAKDKDGNVIRKWSDHNTDVANGRNEVAGLVAGIVGTNFPFMGLATSTNTTAITDADTGLGLGSTDAATATTSLITTTTLNDTARFQAVINYIPARTIGKAGLFWNLGAPDASAMGFVSLISPTVAMPAGSALTIVWTVQIT